MIELGDIAYDTLALRLLLSVITTFLIVNGLYFKYNGKREFLFTYYVIAFMVFFLCFVLDKGEMNLGFALGLFAIFGIIRYRTSTIPIKEMTYLFLTIGIAVINALYSLEMGALLLIFINVAAIILAFVLEKTWSLKEKETVNINYDRVELLHKDKRKELLLDLEERTGLSIKAVEVGKVDFALNSAKLTLTLNN